MLAHTSTGAAFIAVVDSEHDRAAWLRARRQCICASETASVLGCSPWGSLLSLWADKTGRAVPQFADESEWIFWGRVLERAIIEGYAERTGRAAVPFGLLLRSTRYPWLAATPDALVTDDPDAMKHAPQLRKAVQALRHALRKGLPAADLTEALSAAGAGWWPLQTKNIGFTSAEHWVDGVPLYYRAQCVQEALVWGSTRTTGAALIAGQRLAWDDVDASPDDLLTRQVVNLTRRFWESHVTADVEPPADASESARRTLDALYPQQVPEKTVALGGEALDVARQLDELKQRTKEDALALRYLDNQIRQMMGDAERLVLPDSSGFTLKTNVNGARVLLRKKAKE